MRRAHGADRQKISIHALREEGDENPVGIMNTVYRFLSTPSARRATRAENCMTVSKGGNFYPRPPRGGRPSGLRPGAQDHPISIHALREEGDLMYV